MPKKKNDNLEEVKDQVTKPEDNNTFIPINFNGDEEERKLLEKICEAQEIILDKEHSIQIGNGSSSVLYTISTRFIDSAFKILVEEMRNKGLNEIEIDCGGRMTIGVSNRESDDGEKEGSLSPYIKVGPASKLATKSDFSTEAD